MPIYEYRCGKCGHTFEKLIRGMTEETEPQCPNCGEAKVERIVSLFGRVGSVESIPSGGGGCAPVGGG